MTQPITRATLIPVLALVLALLPVQLAWPAALDTGREDVRAFIDQMHGEHGLDPAEVEALLAQVDIKQSILDAISRPAERTLTWAEYRPIFLTEERIRLGQEFWAVHREDIARIAAQYGVEPSILVAIIGVETKYGRISGSYRVLDALGTLAFEYPPRARFFRAELSHFLVLSGEAGVDPLQALGSYAGAMGAPQFIPSSFRAYAIDDDEDGHTDLWQNWRDVLASVANYFHRHGWQDGEPVAFSATRDGDGPEGSRDLGLKTTLQALREQGWRFDGDLPGETPAMAIRLDGAEGLEFWVGLKNFDVITRYNRSVLYAMAVHQLATELALRLPAAP